MRFAHASGIVTCVSGTIRRREILDENPRNIEQSMVPYHRLLRQIFSQKSGSAGRQIWIDQKSKSEDYNRFSARTHWINDKMAEDRGKVGNPQARECTDAAGTKK